MKRAVVALIGAWSLTLGVAVASAHHGPGGGWGGGTQSPRAAVAGTIVSVDTANNTFVANAYVLTGPSFTGYPAPRSPGRGFGHGHGYGRGSHSAGDQASSGATSTTPTTATSSTTPTTTQVTISTNSSTKLVVNGKTATISDLASGQRFVALFSGSSSDTIQALTANPALAVFAHTPPTPKQLYAFVGTVRAVSPTTSAGSVTVTVADSYPSGFFTSPATFTIGPNTVILGGNSTTGNGLIGGSLSNVSVGDTVAGGLIAPSGDTAAQVEALPLAVLVDFPASTASGSATAEQSALNSTLSLFGVKNTTTTKKKSKHKGHSHSKGKHHTKK
jgi:hypothetical protein